MKSDWLTRAENDLRRAAPEISVCATYITEQMSRLLMARLPVDAGRMLCGLLPSAPNCLSDVLHSEADPSIGYPDLMLQAIEGIRIKCAGLAPNFSEEELESYGRLSADTFLESIGRNIPESTLQQLVDFLPAELTQRMHIRMVQGRRDTAA